MDDINSLHVGVGIFESGYVERKVSMDTDYPKEESILAIFDWLIAFTHALDFTRNPFGLRMKYMSWIS